MCPVTRAAEVTGVSEAVERGTRTGWLTQSSPTTTIASLCQQRSWRGTLMALNGTRSLDITQNLLRLYCHVFPQFQCIEESGYVCGMVKICSIMAKKIMPAEYAAKFMPCIPQRSSLQFEDWCSRYMKGQVSKRENKVNVGTVSELSHMAKLLRNYKRGESNNDSLHTLVLKAWTWVLSMFGYHTNWPLLMLLKVTLRTSTII